MTLPPIVHHRRYFAEGMPARHRFPMNKFSRLAEVLLEQGLVRDGGFEVPEPADADLLHLAHDPSYVAQVLAADVDPKVARKIGFPMTAAVASRARHAVGGTLRAARLALRHGVACNTAGGSHHADRDGGAGFCVFNDVAVASLALLEEGIIDKVLVVDCDVHQGDGTARIFAGDPRVFTYSLHCESNWPHRKAAGDLDVGLPRGARDQDYLAALAADLGRLADEARPDLVFYNAGVDPHADDKLGLLNLSDDGLRARDAFVIGTLTARDIPVAGVLGGGYHDDVDVLARRHAFLHAAAAEAAREFV